MTSRGAAETQQLQERLEAQLERLVQQLAELEECRDDLEASEYEETKAETVEQLRELNESLSKMLSGDMTLVDRLGAVQLATQAAISAAFKTPLVLRAFLKKEPDALRTRLAEVERDLALGRLVQSKGCQQRLEILRALQQLGETLTSSQRLDLEESAASQVAINANFEKLDNEKEAAFLSEKARALAAAAAQTPDV